MNSIPLKRIGRVGIPFKGRLYSADWIADNSTLTVSWHHIEKTVPLGRYKDDPVKLARVVLEEIIEVIGPRNERPRG